VPNIFISYRREDCFAHAGRIYDRLVAEFGRSQVFMDIDTIEPGADFTEVIGQTVGSCDTLLAVIGKSWGSITDPDGRRRLDNPEDFVRIEIAAALERRVRVIPVLVGGARMPRSDELPQSLAALARNNALDIPDIAFHPLLERLIASLRKLDARAEEKAAAEQRARDEERRSRDQIEAREIARHEEATRKYAEEIEKLKAALENVRREAIEQIRGRDEQIATLGVMRETADREAKQQSDKHNEETEALRCALADATIERQNLRTTLEAAERDSGEQLRKRDEEIASLGTALARTNREVDGQHEKINNLSVALAAAGNEVAKQEKECAALREALAATNREAAKKEQREVTAREQTLAQSLRRERELQIAALEMEEAYAEGLDIVAGNRVAFGPAAHLDSGNVEYILPITFRQAIRGFQTRIQVAKTQTCPKCKGKESDERPACSLCTGTGQVSQFAGWVKFNLKCPRCAGTGKLKNDCASCRGTGSVSESVDIRIPAGVMDGSRLRVAGQGNPLSLFGSTGDLYITIRVAEHFLFARDGDNVSLETAITPTEANTGTVIEIPTLDGRTKLKIPAGTQHGQRFRLRERGVLNSRKGSRGDQIVTVSLRWPAY
jgi:curved DNA-binding protein CbpA